MAKLYTIEFPEKIDSYSFSHFVRFATLKEIREAGYVPRGSLVQFLFLANKLDEIVKICEPNNPFHDRFNEAISATFQLAPEIAKDFMEKCIQEDNDEEIKQ